MKEKKYSADYRRFTNLMDRLLMFSHEELKQCEAEYRKEAKANPNRRGPKRKKRKAKRSSSDSRALGEGD